jgi:glycosyltransferase involved in cell wall biosynthesis
VLHVLTSAQSLVFLTGQLRHLTYCGFRVLVACSPGVGLEEWAEREQVETRVIPIRREPAPIDDLFSFFRLLRLINRVQPQVVHAHTPKAGLLAMAAAYICRVPVRVFHLHGLGCTAAKGAGARVTKFLEKCTASIATDVVCVSQSLREAADDLRIVTRSKSIVLGNGSANGVDISKFTPISANERAARKQSLGFPPDRRIIGFVGRLTPEKGIEELYAAFRTLRERGVDAGLLLVGPIDDRAPISPVLLETLTRDPDVRLVGYVEDTWRYYPLLDVLALPSWREGFGMCAIEAGACAVPVVATDVVGCRDAVAHGETGTLVPVNEPLLLARAVEQYLTDTALAMCHGNAGRERVTRHFNCRDIWTSVATLYFDRLTRSLVDVPVLSDLTARSGTVK